MNAPRAMIVRAPGTNRDGDVALALTLAGAHPFVALIGELEARPSLLDTADLLVLAGGFSYADSLGAGRVWALDLHRHLGDALARFAGSGRPVIGICNGFQALVRTGLLAGLGAERRVALAANDTGRFDCRWVRLHPVSQRCVWTAGLDPVVTIDCPIAHGEGRVVCDDDTLAALRAGDQIALRYDVNPNGSVDGIAGITDPSGVVLGLMPHPENHVLARQHPTYLRRAGGPGPAAGLGLELFVNGVRHAKELSL